MQLLRDAHARAVELAHEVRVVAVSVLLAEDEVRRPDERQRRALHADRGHDRRQIRLEALHHRLELRIVRSVAHIRSARRERRGDAALGGLLVDDLRRRVVDHVHAQLALDDTRQEALVNQLAILANDVLLAERHEIVDRLLLLVVVHSLLQVEDRRSGHLALLAILDLAHPDALTLAAAVLLQHAHARRDALRELLLEGIDVVVRVRVRHAAAEVLDLHEGVLRTHLDHRIRVRHRLHARRSHLAEHAVKRRLRHAVVRARVDTRDVALAAQKLSLHLLELRVAVEDRVRRPALLDERIADGDGVAAVSVRLLVRATLALDDDDLADGFRRLRQDLHDGASRELVRWCRRRGRCRSGRRCGGRFLCPLRLLRSGSGRRCRRGCWLRCRSLSWRRLRTCTATHTFSIRTRVSLKLEQTTCTG